MASNNNAKKEQMKDLINALGVVAELSLVFYRDTLGAGATTEEAFKLTKAFIEANLFGNTRGKQEQN